MRLLLPIVTSIILGSCTKGLPPLRTWEVAEAKAGSKEIDFSFTAPHRDPSDGYWDYKLGIVLPKGVDFGLSGQVKIFSLSGETMSSFRFDSATGSNWLKDKNRISHLLAGKLAIEDGNACRVELKFDRPLDRDAAVVLHFLSHEDNPPPSIQSAHD